MLLLLYGGAVFLLVDRAVFESLPNHGRIALLIPVTWGALLPCFPVFLDWKGSAADLRLRALAVVAATAGVHLGSLAWWLFAPETRG